jgi:hypothetical protein
MKKRANLMFLKNKALTVFRFGHKEDPKEGLKGTDGISPEVHAFNSGVESGRALENERITKVLQRLVEKYQGTTLSAVEALSLSIEELNKVQK